MKEINTPDKRFVDGNGRDVLGTVVTADWLNAVQGEIVGLITGFNAKVNGAVPNQMYRAIANALAEKANASIAITAGNGLTGGGDLSDDCAITLGTPSTITATSGNSVEDDSHSHAIDKASTNTPGIVQLNNTLTSTAADQALTAAMGKKLQDEKLGKSDRSNAVNSDDANKVATSKAVKTAYDKAVGAEEIANRKSEVAVLTGVIYDGDTLPLPAGYTDSQCKWLVSLRDDNASGARWDIDEGGSHNHFAYLIHADGARRVTAKMRLNGYPDRSIHVNYIVIGVK